MKKVKEFLGHLDPQKTSIHLFLFILLFLSLLIKTKINAAIISVYRLLPNLIQEYLQNVPIKNEDIFLILNIVFVFEVIMGVYLYFANKQGFQKKESVRKTFSNTILWMFTFILLGNILSILGIFPLGAAEYLVYMEANLVVNSIFIAIYFAHAIILLDLFFEYFSK